MSKQKPIRFAALVRVSTEKQEKTGESLLTQKTQIEEAVKHLGGTVAGWYGGQEHATPGWEKREIDRLIGDARQGIFEAVIVTNIDRWSRDNGKSQEGYELFKKHGIRFFAGSRELDLFKPEDRLFLGITAEFGQFQASHQNLKSIQNRIHRARRGLPTCGKLPFGRTFDKKTGTWGIDAEKQAIIEDVARRYLAGEKRPALAVEYGLNDSNLHKILTKRCGDTWEQEFRLDDFNIREVVRTPIPRLLPEETILAIRQRAEANKTYAHGQQKHDYLFGRMVFCGHCGYAMFGQVNHQGHRYYRHARKDRVKECGYPKIWVRADQLEEVVFRHLFGAFGNPAAVQRAIERATPNAEKVEQARKRLNWITGELEKIKAERGRLVRIISKGTITEADADDVLGELAERESRLKDEYDQLVTSLEHVPTPATVKNTAERFSDKFISYSNAWLVETCAEADRRYDRMTQEEKRSLAEMVFGGKTPDGRRMGIYVQWPEEQRKSNWKRWNYSLWGHLIEDDGWIPLDCTGNLDRFSDIGGPRRKLEVTKSASS